MKGMTDWNKLTMEQYIEHLEEKFKFDSSGTAKAVFELIAGYRALTIQRVSVMLCGSFDADLSTSSATKCKCGREKWEHPKAT